MLVAKISTKDGSTSFSFEPSNSEYSLGFQKSEVSGRYPNEKNDCVVCALSVVSGVEYKKVHWLCKQFGRKDRRMTRMSPQMFESVTTALGIKAHCLSGYKGLSLKRLVSNYPSGNMLVIVKKHIFVIKNGVVLDDAPKSPRCRVKSAWVIEKGF